MKLVIHDLDKDLWDRLKDGFKDCTAVSDNGTIRPCTGCFGCWNRTPGVCSVKDGYENMGQLIHQAEEVIVISRYTYGGFSSFVKNVFDRCLAYVLPHFELVNGQSHHKKRYDEDKPFSFLFYGQKLTDEEKESAVRYVTAVCTNIRGHVRKVVFSECGEPVPLKTREPYDPDGRIVLLNASMRYANGNTAKLAEKLREFLNRENSVINLMQRKNDFPQLIRELDDASVLILCQPLYVDGLPSQMIRFLETFRKNDTGKKKKIYVLANMGLYESNQLENLFETVRQWSEAMGFDYGGGLGVSAGELVGVLMDWGRFDRWPLRTISKGIKQLAEAVNEDRNIPDLYTEPLHFPRSVYIAIANSGWKSAAKKNGTDPKQLFRQID